MLKNALIFCVMMALICNPLTLDTSNFNRDDVELKALKAEPVTLSLIGIAVGLAGIASDVYGMSREADVATVVSDKVAQVTINQLKIGLSPLKELNPTLKGLANGQAQLKRNQARLLNGQTRLQANQTRLLAGQRQLRAGQTRLLAGQRELRAGQTHLQEGQRELYEQLKTLQAQLMSSDKEMSTLMHLLHEENLNEHRRTQSLVIGLQEARYGAALKLIELAAQVYHQDAQRAEAWFREALTALLETQSYFEMQHRQGTYVSREYLALIHLSLSTCYVGLGLYDQAVTEVARLVSLPSPGESLEVLVELEMRAERPLFQRDMLIELRSWSASVQDERRRLSEMKRRAISLLERHPKLHAAWSQRDNAALGRAQLAEYELALQAYATLIARSSSSSAPQQTSSAKPTAPTSKVERTEPSRVQDPHRDEELAALKRVARALKEVKSLSTQIKELSKLSGLPPTSQLTKARRVFQRVSAEVEPQAELSALLTSCVAREHPTRGVDCARGVSFIKDIRTVLTEIDRALDHIEQSPESLRGDTGR